MQNRVIYFQSLVSNILRNTGFIAKLVDRVDEIFIGPKFSTPKVFFHFGMPPAYFSGCDTFDQPDYYTCALCWNRLNQKMNMIFVCTNLQKMNLVPLLNLHTYFLHGLINCFAKYNLSILGRTNKMVQQYAYIV